MADGASSSDAGNPQVRCIFHEGTNTMTYLVWDVESKQAMVVDTVWDYDPASGTFSNEHNEKVDGVIKELGLEILYIVDTHVHADHVTGSQFFKERYPDAQVVIGEAVRVVQETFKPMFGLGDEFATDGSQFDKLMTEDDTLPLGGLKARALHTPGHTPACMTWVVDGPGAHGVVLTGDTIFMEDFGTARTDFPKGDAEALWHSIKDKIFSLPDSYRVFVGHDYGPEGREIKWETTVGAEKEKNKHVKEGTEAEEFINWRRERDASLGTPRLLLPAIQVNLRAGKLPPADDEGRTFLKIPVKCK